MSKPKLEIEFVLLMLLKQTVTHKYFESRFDKPVFGKKGSCCARIVSFRISLIYNANNGKPN